MSKEVKKLVEKHPQLTHSEMLRVLSHAQRKSGDWIQNTLMVEDCDVPFKFKRKKQLTSLKGCRVNLTYYPATEHVAAFDVDVMNVVRIKRS